MGPGKTHYIVNALSRSPMVDTSDDDYTISCNYQNVETVWDSIKEGAKSMQYAKLQSAVEKGESDPGSSQFKTLMHCLSLRQIDDVLMVILDSTRMVIPDKSQKVVLKELHKAHSGISKTYATAVQLYYWPGMKNCIKTFLSSRKICIKHSPSQARPPVTGTAPSAAQSPMNDLGIDLFDALGKKWLAILCRFSGYAWLSQLQKTTTASVLESLENLFLENGYPSSIRSDGGPQFRSEFAEYCKTKNISYELASPYNPESNALAEAAIKNLKSLVIRCDEANENLRQAIAAWQNMVRTDGSSPAQMSFSRTQKQGLPLLNPNAKPFEPEALIKRRDKLHEQRIKLRDQHSVVIEDLAPVQEVLMQDYLSGLWKESAVVLSK